ncbi:MAG: trypsin-like serine protease [Pseudomonadota bacterium]
MRWIIALLACFTTTSVAGVKPIYGNDDRVEVYQSNTSMCNVATSVAAIYPAQALTPLQQDQWRLNAGSSLLEKNWCSSERFVTQSSGARCTAFLVSDNMAVTAGHCINDIGDKYGPGINCPNAVFVFDHQLDRYDNLPRTIGASQIYRCAAVMDGYSSMTSLDWRVVELDRSPGRRPLPVHSGQLEESPDYTLDIVGHPLGLPMKVARNGTLLNADDDQVLVAAIDSYEGNSGSPVLTEVNGQLAVIGVLSSGEIDTAVDTGSECTYSRRCSTTDCSGERITRTSAFLSWASMTHDNPQANWLYRTNRMCR